MARDGAPPRIPQGWDGGVVMGGALPGVPP